MKKIKVLVALAVMLLGALKSDAAGADDRFKGGGYDGYAKQDEAVLGIPAIRPKGTLIQFM